MKVENIQGGEVMPLKKKLLRLAPFVGALLLLTSVIWPLPVDQGTISAIACILFLVGFLGFLDRSFELRHPKNLAIITAWIIVIGFVAADYVWREGKIVAEAWFNPGIAPFDITVREVPVPVTKSHHFVVTLKRGQYPVTSFRFFWIGYTPEKVRIEWKRLETFNVIFDDRYVATCNWSWGREAAWTVKVPPGSEAPGDQP